MNPKTSNIPTNNSLTGNLPTSKKEAPPDIGHRAHDRRACTNRRNTLATFAALCCGVIGLPGGSLDAGAASDHSTGQPSGQTEEIVVRAHPLADDGLAQPLEILAGDALDRQRTGTIGDTLNGLPGIHGTSFGTAVGRPVINGLGTSRVRVMEDRIDTLDVSVTSDDHAATIDPFMADRIEVLKGASTLLYGSGAIGGAVNIVTGRVPQVLPDRIGARLEAQSESVNNQQTFVGRIDGAAGNVALHADFFHRDADPYDIPGYAESARMRALEEEHGHEEEDEHDDEDEHHEDEEEAFGSLPNSNVKTQGGAFGASFIHERGFVGLSVSRYEADYGLPGAHHHHEEEHHDEDEGEEHEDEHDEHEEGEEGAALDLSQTRYDLKGRYDIDGAIWQSISLRAGFSDYSHLEVEGEEGGTRFANDAWEIRMEAAHSLFADTNGIIGMQFSRRDFQAIGSEAFVPPNQSRASALFVAEEMSAGPASLEFGARLENIDYEAEGFTPQDFNTFSASIGVIVPQGDWRIAGQLDFASRAPIAEELFSGGPHLATQTYDIGDPDLDNERSINANLGVDWASGPWRMHGSLFQTNFRDFIFQTASGDEEDGLPVHHWNQADSTFRGLDLEGAFTMLDQPNLSSELMLRYDQVDGSINSAASNAAYGSDNLPRIPPRRFGINWLTETGPWTFELAYRRIAAQDRVAAFELPTDSYNDLDLHVNWRRDVAGATLELFLIGRNLGDDEQRNHLSFIKDMAPLPGRSVVGGVRFAF